MTLISQIIADAYRESNLIAIETAPTANEITEALRLLNRDIRSMFGNEFGEPLSVLPFGRNNIQTPNEISIYMEDIQGYYAPVNTRLMCNLDSSESINLDPTPYDGSRFGVVDVSGNFNTLPLTLVGNGRKIEGATSVTINTASVTKEWFYREDLGEWVVLTELIASDDSPFPEEFDDLLITRLAVRLAPRSGEALDTMSQLTLQRMEKKFKARYVQKKYEQSEIGLQRLTSNRRNYSGADTLSDFSKGRTRW